MTMTTYDGPVAAPEAKPVAKPAGKGWWARFFAAMVEARMRQAEREIAYYRHLHADLFDRKPETFGYRNDGKLPFVR